MEKHSLTESMKGTLEVCFPKILGKILNTQQVANLKGKKNLLTDHFRLAYQKKLVSKYLEAVRREYWLKSQGPVWQSFAPSKVSLRLDSDWIDYSSLVVRFGHYLADKNPITSKLEIIISAKDASRITRESPLIKVNQIVLSDINSSSPDEEWKGAAGYSSIAKLHSSFGVELQVSTWNGDGINLRKQLKAVSKLNPDFIRICQRRVAVDDTLFGGTDSVSSRMRTLQLGLEAFATLGYETAALYSHQIVLKQTNDSKIDIKDNSAYGARRTLAIGAGGISMRFDADGRVITQRNSEHFSQYINNIKQLWRKRAGVTAAQYLPYVHQEIESSFHKDGLLSYAKIRDRFGINLEDLHPGLARVLEQAGYVRCRGEVILLTERGKSVRSNVARNFFVTESDLHCLY